jgi:hypothetical protein
LLLTATDSWKKTIKSAKEPSYEPYENEEETNNLFQNIEDDHMEEALVFKYWQSYDYSEIDP